MREISAKSREIQDYYSAVIMKSSGDISADHVRQGDVSSKLRLAGQIQPAKTFHTAR